MAELLLLRALLKHNGTMALLVVPYVALALEKRDYLRDVWSPLQVCSTRGREARKEGRKVQESSTSRSVHGAESSRGRDNCHARGEDVPRRSGQAKPLARQYTCSTGNTAVILVMQANRDEKGGKNETFNTWRLSTTFNIPNYDWLPGVPHIRAASFYCFLRNS